MEKSHFCWTTFWGAGHCQAALFETNPMKLLERIAHARGVILERIEDGYKKPPTSEQIALLDALSTPDSLRRITERQNGYQPKAS
jgi:phosphoribosylaminoimidazole-succinocarboxamide synthase